MLKATIEATSAVASHSAKPKGAFPNKCFVDEGLCATDSINDPNIMFTLTGFSFAEPTAVEQQLREEVATVWEETATVRAELVSAQEELTSAAAERTVVEQQLQEEVAIIRAQLVSAQEELASAAAEQAHQAEQSRDRDAASMAGEQATAASMEALESQLTDSRAAVETADAAAAAARSKASAAIDAQNQAESTLHEVRTYNLSVTLDSKHNFCRLYTHACYACCAA